MRPKTYKLDTARIGALLLIGVGGCSSEAPRSDYEIHCTGDALAGLPAGQRVVQGTWRDTVLGSSAGSLVVRARDLSGVAISALLGDTFQERRGYGSADGRFCVPGVPVGGYWLKVASTKPGQSIFFFTAADTVDLGSEDLVRTRDLAKGIDTSLELDLRGLSPCVGGDQIVGYVPTLDGQTPFWDRREAGATAETYRGRWRIGNVSSPIDGSKGDRLWVTQLCESAVDSGAYTLTAAAELPAFTMTEGATTQQSATLSTVPQDRSFEASVKLAAFASYEGALVGPAASPADASATISASAVPYPDVDTLFGATLLEVQLDGAAARQDQGFKVAYGSPFPATWPTRYSVDFGRVVTLTAPGATSGRRVSSSISTEHKGALPPGGVAPLLSPVTAIQINGRDGWTPQNQLDLTPTLSWSPPALGTASIYGVRVIELSVTATKGTALSRTYLSSDLTSIKLPPGVLQSGKTYVFQISAMTGPTTAQRSAPYRSSLPLGWADTLSALMQTR